MLFNLPSAGLLDSIYTITYYKTSSTSLLSKAKLMLIPAKTKIKRDWVNTAVTMEPLGA